MAKSLLEQLPEIVRAGKRRAQQILDHAERAQRVTLQTREVVIPNKNRSGLDIFDASGTGGKNGFHAQHHGTHEQHGDIHEQHGDTHDSPNLDSLNRLIYGNNLLAMSALLAGDHSTPSLRGTIDMIYIDPPYDSKSDYRTKIQLPGGDVNQSPTVAEQFAYSDTWEKGTVSYLEMLTPRLVLMRELLAPGGVICVHLDWHVGHYVKILLDDIFGKHSFINELIWRYGKMSNASKKFPQNHDTILTYARGDNYTFSPVRVSDSEYKTRFANLLTDNRVLFGSVKHSADKLILGRIKKVRAQLDRELRDEDVLFDFYTEFKTQDDVFYDISIVKGNASENLHFDTQKPQRLLERLIGAFTQPGDIVADFYVGSGTTVAAAETLKRRWLATDIGKPAAMITRKRLVDLEATPFLYQAIGDYQIEQARSSLGRKFRVGDLAHTVLGIYGATPLPESENVNGSLGRIPGSKTLIYVDSPNRLTTVSTLKRVQAYRDSKMGGFHSAVILGWNFSEGIGHAIEALADKRLDVRVIPANLLDELKKKGFEKLTRESTIRFSTLQYLAATASRRTINSSTEAIEASLTNYVLLDPSAMPLDDKGRTRVIEVMNNNPLTLIEYWAIDPDYDGKTFRSVWQDYRNNSSHEGNPLSVTTSAELALPLREGARRVCIRAVDVFGYESEYVTTLERARP
ncbi:site-specific DNA-methyltransferase [Lysinibacter sp. HNR]|uniref:DNA methyltransferase n=1 Tax=Lysinibacter sp. HNR TaxID=3031408 RepID=UPI0024348147|nr:site-specific DNA-methyltransferase [Lysinibacter sp. HNR]WGD37404.1 site-specific DNA-methyltransferase [Lysinibacter sp. HNR]